MAWVSEPSSRKNYPHEFQKSQYLLQCPLINNQVSIGTQELPYEKERPEESLPVRPRMATMHPTCTPFQHPVFSRRTAKIAGFRHTIVNTNYVFEVFRGSLGRIPDGFRWLAKEKLDEVPLSTAAKKALACLAKCDGH